MSISVQDLLSSAERLLTRAVGEPCYRASINRSYYAAYHDCRNWHGALPTAGALSPKSRGMHAELIYRLENPSVKDAKTRANSRRRAYILQSMKKARTVADYELSDTVTESDSMQSIANAKIIIAI